MSGFAPVHHFADLQPEPDSTLLGQGFIPPDFNTGRIRALLARLVRLGLPKLMGGWGKRVPMILASLNRGLPQVGLMFLF